MAIRKVRLGKLPDSLMDDVMRHHRCYSVGLARVRENNPETFKPLGSGTLVSRKKLLGVLTARHCLHACNPSVQIGSKGGDTMIFILSGKKTVQFPSEALIEHTLCKPKSEEYGPDLVFIEILPGGLLDLVKGIGSFWPMEQDTEALIKRFAKPTMPICFVGYPEADFKSDVKDKTIFFAHRHMTYFGVIDDGDIYERDGWDYLESKFNYYQNNELPQSFSGVSGGPLWAVELRGGKKKTDPIKIGKAALIGVTFYQVYRRRNIARLRAHFIRSIYDLAWRPPKAEKALTGF